MADIVRLLGLGTGATLLGLAASAVVALVGAWAAVRWHRLGQVGLAVNLCGVAGLLASPVSWRTTSSGWCRWGEPGPGGAARHAASSRSMLVLGWLFVGWVAAAPRG